MRKPAILFVLIVTTLFGTPLSAAARDRWVEVRSPNFIVVSNDSESQAQKVAVHFEQIRALFRASLPYANGHSSTIITILAVKDENSLRELLPEYWEVKGHSHPAGIFIDRFYNFQVAVDLGANFGNPYEAIYHEYYHSVTTPYFPQLPVWVSEGMADFYGNSEVESKEAKIGMPDAALIQELRMHPLIPLSVLFKVDRNSPYYNEQNKVNIFYAESWALAHYLMLGDRGNHRALFTAYLSALSQGATQEAAATKAFGDLGNLQRDLQRYVQNSAFYEIKTQAPETIDPSSLHARTLSDAETDAYRGGFLALHGRDKEAKPLLDEAVRLDPQLALAQQNLALLDYVQQQQNDALASLSAAIGLDPHNALTHYLRAEIGFRVGDGQHGQYEEDLRQAIVINPEFALPYGLLAVYLAQDGNDKLPEALSLAKQGVTLEPGSGTLRLALAQILMNMRRFDEGEALARQVQSDSSDAQYRDQAGRVLEAVRRAREIESIRSASSSSSQSSAPVPGLSNAGDDSDPKIVLKHRDPFAEGIVTQVTCNGEAMEVTIATGNGSAAFHAADRTKVTYISDLPKHLGDIEPCTELKGHTVKLIYKQDTLPRELVHVETEQ